MDLGEFSKASAIYQRGLTLIEEAYQGDIKKEEIIMMVSMPLAESY